MLRIARGSQLTWYDVEKPAIKDVGKLKAELGVHPLVLDELIPQVRHPKLDLFGSHLFLVLTIPVVERGNDLDGQVVRLEELDIIFSKNWVVTSHYRPIEIIDSVFERVEGERGEHIEYLDSASPAALLYAILSALLQGAVASLGNIEERVERAEQAISSGQERKMVQELAELRRDIIDFRRALAPARPVFRALDDTGPALLGPDSLPYFRNLTGRIEQISTLLKTLKETVESLEETTHSLLATHTNDIIRMLTLFTAGMLPLTLIASIFGMNITFPFKEDTAHFWIVIGAMIMIGLGLLAFFRARRWI